MAVRTLTPPAVPPIDCCAANSLKGVVAAVDADDLSDDDYFSSTYRPLSNLPTPPPSSRNSSALQSPQLEQGEALEESLLGPAIHLVNMLPPAASLATPSVPLVQAMLTRAALPLDTIALAVCILDSLDARFSRTWRLTCPLNQDVDKEADGEKDGEQQQLENEKGPMRMPPQPLKRHTLPPAAATFDSFAFSSHSSFSSRSPSSSYSQRHPRHIDSVFPEVIILAALVIATKFTDDGHAGQQAAHSYCAWGQRNDAGAHADAPLCRRLSLWSASQLSATERCVMQSLGYRILPLLDADLLADARDDMRQHDVITWRLGPSVSGFLGAERKPTEKNQRNEDEKEYRSSGGVGFAFLLFFLILYEEGAAST
ncbi:hypothetical protein CMQ_2581 [Grosmannia clavigera kw1407]|uniref:Cyclin N-terminal domain-containing protein n=1 Tax=Grosmannia clavigera (strain kw1407 / UAMH 11150) TaxID=655863 RepID=F0XHZ6_GROCL|nr:uncharacterized protein CMQ_2581 [Grosmannia clavigera kw1407]EFX02652.1 hypothetical protein CMQ_2581 [Grosmannia clavigera kw1407]